MHTRTSVLPWQNDTWEQFSVKRLQRQLAHAYLFVGAKGVGKRHFAQLLAGKLLCEAALDDSPYACGSCKQCRLVESDSHPDLLNVGLDDGAKLVKIDQIRHMAEFMGKSAQQGGRKIVLIDPADKMNVNASNALLKTLEEPSKNSLILLLTANLGSLLPTIRSRCQRVDFPAPSSKLALPWLQQQLAGVEPQTDLAADQASQPGHSPERREASLQACLQLAAGAPLMALQLAVNGGLTLNETMLKQLSAVMKREQSVSEVAKVWAEGDPIIFLSWMMSWAEQCIKYKLTGDPAQIVTEEARKMLCFLAERNSVESLYVLLNHLREQYLVVGGQNNPNLPLLFEYVLSQWLSMMPRVSRQ